MGPAWAWASTHLGDVSGMRILLVFNHYQQRGGEEQAFTAEADLLESKGHFVLRYTLSNDAIDRMSRLDLARRILWNGASYRDIRNMVRTNAIDIVHFHNTFPLISPAAYYAAKRAGARVVQTLHNFRLICPGALLSREAGVCEDCVGRRLAWRSISHACYRRSRVQSAAVTAMLATHRAAGTWTRRVDRYIALSEFAKQKFVQGCLPAERISVKPNFVCPDPGAGEARGGYALFVGRLSAEKGISTMLRAWCNSGDLPALRVVGDGPLADEVRMAAAAPKSEIEYLGRRSRDEALRLMQDAMFLVFPSIWYEGFPMTIAEAYASGLPVLSSRLGTMKSVVKHGITGLHFTPGDTDSLVSCVRWVVEHPRELSEFRQNARSEYLANYSADDNYRTLIGIYQEAMGTRSPEALYSAKALVRGQAEGQNAA